MKSPSTLRLILASLACTQCISNAAVLTDESQLSSGNTLIDFEMFSPGTVSNPFVIGNATFSSSQFLSIEDATPYSPPPRVVHHVLRANSGTGIFDHPYVDIRIDFASPVSQVGLGWWDPNIAGNELLVYNAAGVLLESAPIPTGPPGGGFATFRGISRPANEIAYAIMHISGGNDIYGIDNVSYGQVPEPSCAMLMLASGLVCLRRNRRI